MGKSTISMVIFHSYVKLPEGTFRWVPKLQQSNEVQVKPPWKVCKCWSSGQHIQLLVKAEAPKNQEETLETIPDLHPSPPGPCIAQCIAA